MTLAALDCLTAHLDTGGDFLDFVVFLAGAGLEALGALTMQAGSATSYGLEEETERALPFPLERVSICQREISGERAEEAAGAADSGGSSHTEADHAMLSWPASEGRMRTRCAFWTSAKEWRNLFLAAQTDAEQRGKAIKKG